MRAVRFLRATAVLFVAVIALGTLTEWALRWRDDGRISLRGQLVGVRGATLHLDCRGVGRPTVVLESGLDHLGALSWSAVHDDLARTTRVCAYSRAGILTSDAGRGAFDAGEAAMTLHRTLIETGESAPWIMVGHSIGGPYVMAFTSRYLSEVTGMVLVDPSHPQQIARLEAATGRSMRIPVRPLRLVAALTWTGVARLIPTGANPRTWPADVIRVGDAFYSRGFSAVVREAVGIDSTFAQAGRMPDLEERPLTILTAGAPLDSAELASQGLSPEQGRRKAIVWRAMHQELMSLSRNAVHRVVDDATHYIQFDRPDVVMEAIERIITRTRATEY